MRLLALALLAASCAPFVVVDEAEPDEPADAAAAPSCAEDRWACEACLAHESEHTCTAPLLACESEPDCGAFDECYSGNLLDVMPCRGAHPVGEVAWRALVACVCGPCADVCCSSCAGPWGQR